MKKRILLIILLCSTIIMNAQDVLPNHSPFSFDHRYYECENQWVVIPKKKDVDKYAFGYIYLDAMAGLTFEYEGDLRIDENGRFNRVDSGPKTYTVKQRLGKTTNILLALLPTKKIIELRLELNPKLLDGYRIPDPVMHDIALGRTLNANEECRAALPYLEKAYSMRPTAPGVEFELGYAYNGVGKYTDAIRVLSNAIAHNPEDISLYKELGFAQSYSGDFESALRSYNHGFALDELQNYGYKGEMAFHMAMIYKENYKDEEQFKLWGTKALSLTGKDSFIYKKLTSLGITGDVVSKPNETGTFKDQRDGQIYKWVKIGRQTWMSQNMNYKPQSGSWSYNNDEKNSTQFGLLYSFEVLDQISPKGWHVPSEAEWQSLEIALGMSKDDASGPGLYKGNIAGKFLAGGSSGFEVLFGGGRRSTMFEHLGDQASFWSTTRNGNPIYTRLFKQGDSRICHNTIGSAHSLSVRCIKDETN